MGIFTKGLVPSQNPSGHCVPRIHHNFHVWLILMVQNTQTALINTTKGFKRVVDNSKNFRGGQKKVLYSKFLKIIKLFKNIQIDYKWLKSI